MQGGMKGDEAARSGRGCVQSAVFSGSSCLMKLKIKMIKSKPTASHTRADDSNYRGTEEGGGDSRHVINVQPEVAQHLTSVNPSHLLCLLSQIEKNY